MLGAERVDHARRPCACLARRLAGRGCSHEVVGCSRKPAEWEHPHYRHVLADVASDEDMRRVVGEVRRYFRDKGWRIKVPRRLQELRLQVNRARVELSQTMSAKIEYLSFSGLDRVDDGLGVIRAGLNFRLGQ